MSSKAVQLQEDATGWADEFGGISQSAEQWADQFAEQIVPNEEVCPCSNTYALLQAASVRCQHLAFFTKSGGTFSRPAPHKWQLWNASF